MATVDKKSVRAEIDRLKAEFEALRSAGKVSDEVRVLMSSLLMVVELILSIFLEKKTRKTSRNSSIPPSQTDKDETTPPQGRSGGKGRAQSSKAAGNTRTVETITVAPVEECPVCGESLEDVACSHHKRRTKIDIIFEKVVEHVDAEVKQCPACDTTAKGRFPDDMPGPLQYGHGLMAFVINLLVAQMVTLNRVQKLVATMIKATLSEATLLGFVLRLHKSLEGWEEQAIVQLLDQPALYVDETSLRVNRKNHWIHVCSGGGITLKRRHRKRGREAIEEINIIPRYGGTIVHDCWASYLSYDHCSHGLCGSHLLRELVFVIDSNDYRWAKNMKRLLQETSRKVAGRDEKRLNDKELVNLQKRYRNILTRGEKELPPIPPKPEGKRGKMAKSDAHNLWERMKKYESAVLLFARDPHVAFTNNRAERDLRMAKVKQKISGCFRTERYADAYCRISSYLQTMNQQGVNPLIAIQMALAGKWAK